MLHRRPVPVWHSFLYKSLGPKSSVLSAAKRRQENNSVHLLFATLPKVLWWSHTSRGRLCSLGLGEQLSEEDSSGPLPHCRLQQGLLVVLESWSTWQGSTHGLENELAMPVSCVISLGPHSSLRETDSTSPTFEMRKLRFRGGTWLTQVTRARFEPRSVSPQRNSWPLPRKTYLRMAS